MSEQHYYALTPDIVLQAIEALGLDLDGSLLTLNSYENRVYRVREYSGKPWVAKFYRPGRWSFAQIREEHEFACELHDSEVPVVPPHDFSEGETLVESQGFMIALFPGVGGREPELENLDNLIQLGRYLGRLHALGARQDFVYRPTLDLQSYGSDSVAYINESDFVPAHLTESYQAITEQILSQLERTFHNYDAEWHIRIHADFHPGNILWTETGPKIVDLDDARMGPAIQDLWMLSGKDSDSLRLRYETLMEGYNDFHDFPVAQLRFIEPLRTLRMLHYTAWLARRWSDPSFQHHFPWFAESRYWEQEILHLKEQLAMLMDDTTFEQLTAY